MENKEITAEWARKTAENILGEKIEKEINMCLDSIKNAVKLNNFSTTVTAYINDLTKQELEKRGFKVVKYTGDQRDGSYSSITW